MQQFIGEREKRKEKKKRKKVDGIEEGAGEVLGRDKRRRIWGRMGNGKEGAGVGAQ